MQQIKNILKEAKWINKTAQESWLDRKVKNPATGREVRVKSLPPEEQAKYRPKNNKLDKEHPDFHSKLTERAKEHLKEKLNLKEKDLEHVYARPSDKGTTLNVPITSDGLDSEHVSDFLKEHADVKKHSIGETMDSGREIATFSFK